MLLLLSALIPFLAPAVEARRMPTAVPSFGGHTSDGIRFGRAVLTLDDLDGDGVSEFAVGAPGATVGGVRNAGRVFIFSGRTRRRLDCWTGTDVRGTGRTLALAADSDDDGCRDVKVGALDESSAQLLRVRPVLRHGSASGVAHPKGAERAPSKRASTRQPDEQVRFSISRRPMAVSITGRCSGTGHCSGDEDSELGATIWGPKWMDVGVGTGVVATQFDDVDRDGVGDLLVGISQWYVLGVPAAHPLGEVQLLSGATGETLWVLPEMGMAALESFLDETGERRCTLLFHGPAASTKAQMQELARAYSDCQRHGAVVVDLTSEHALVRIGDLFARPRSVDVRRHFGIEGDEFEMVLVGAGGALLERYRAVAPADDIWRGLTGVPR